jgi:hypothetical protein
MKLLNDNEWEILCFIEEFYIKESKFPPLVRIVNATKVDHVEVVNALTNPIVKQALDNRGIEWRVVTEGRLTGRQIACIEVLLNIADGRNQTEKLRALGIAPSTYKGWKKNPIFMDAYRQAARDLYGQSIPELHKTVISRAIDGDPSMMKTALAISGEWDDKRTVEAMNVQFVLIKVLEVIQKHVQDPVVLNSIAGEFEEILNPKLIKAIQ